MQAEPQLSIDLSGDVGEGAGNDAAFIPLLTSASVACGGHAGDERSILEAIETASAAGVQVGAHPGFVDRQNFGRREMVLSVSEVFGLVAEQLGEFQRLACSVGASVSHVKPHGALYHQAANDASIAEAVVRATQTLQRPAAVIGPWQSALERAAHAAGLHFIREAFADRAYSSTGRLLARSDPRALIVDETLAIAQTLSIIEKRTVQSGDGKQLPMRCDTICLHGDTPGAIFLATRIRDALRAAQIEVRAFRQ